MGCMLATKNSTAEVDCEDKPVGVPPTEGYDLWALISGRTDDSPRNETVLSFIPGPELPNPNTAGDGALLKGDWKYITGNQSLSGFWPGPDYPNSTQGLPLNAPGCLHGCLYNITADPTEHDDLPSQFPSV